MVIDNFEHENNTHIFNFILSNTASLLSYHLEGADESQKLSEQLRKVIFKKLSSNMQNQSIRNLLLDNYIALSDTQDFD